MNTGVVVPAALFTPPPKVDSQVVILKRYREPVVPHDLQPVFFRLVKAGFSAKRKKLRSSLAGGLQLDKNYIEQLLSRAHISPDVRAEELSIVQWLDLTMLSIVRR